MLKYINNETKRFHIFVANRVASIREATSVVQWRYVSSKSNPADEASRGLSVDNFQSVEEEMTQARDAVESQLLSVSDFSRAESAIIGFSQRVTFMEEITSLGSGGSGIKKTSDIYRLDPVLQGGLLRVGGRLSRSALPEELKHPVILSKGHHVSNLILQYVHQQLGHVGRNHMLSTLR